MQLNDLLKASAEKRASDVHLKVGVPPVLRIDGRLTALQDMGRISREWMMETLYGIMNPNQKEQFVKEHELAHRMQLFMYLRMNGIVPPTTRRKMAKK